MYRFAVILTHNRPDLLRQTWAAIGSQVDVVIIMDNASDPPVDAETFDSAAVGGTWLTAVCAVPDQPPNLSQLWNYGLGWAKTLWGRYVAFGESDGGTERPYVAVLCDDAPPPPGWFDAVTAAMDAQHAAGVDVVIGCSAPEPFGWIGEPRVKTARDSDLTGRMPGWAWIIDPSYPVRPDLRFEWWWGDTDLDIQAREAGGMVMIGSHPVPNLRPNDFSARPEQAAQVAADSQRFVDKYNGWRPW
jgi:hypothetical protein